MKQSRAGFSLIELVAAMATGVVVVALGALTIVGALRGAQRHREHWVNTRGVDRLAEQFRADVRNATQIDPAQAPVLCAFRAGDVEMQYSLVEGGIRRTESSTGRTIRVERYRVSQPIAIDFPNAESKIVRLRFARQPNATEQFVAGRPLEVEAVLGRDRRWVADSKQAEAP